MFPGMMNQLRFPLIYGCSGQAYAQKAQEDTAITILKKLEAKLKKNDASDVDIQRVQEALEGYYLSSKKFHSLGFRLISKKSNKTVDDKVRVIFPALIDSNTLQSNYDQVLEIVIENKSEQDWTDLESLLVVILKSTMNTITQEKKDQDQILRLLKKVFQERYPELLMLCVPYVFLNLDIRQVPLK